MEKRIIALILALAMCLSMTTGVFADDLADDNTMLNFCVDVKLGDEDYAGVLWSYLNSITSGIDNVHFGPTLTITRAQAVTFLWRIAGMPYVNYAMTMDDVAADAYYAEAVRWALSEGIVKGTSENTFSPNQTCTIKEIITMVWRFAGSPVVDYFINLTDVKGDEYYAEALRWAISAGIAKPESSSKFGVDNFCTRSKTAGILYKAAQEIKRMIDKVSEKTESTPTSKGLLMLSATPLDFNDVDLTVLKGINIWDIAVKLK